MHNQMNRIYGFDTARAVAILGMVIVNYKIALNATEEGDAWLVYFTTLLEGRASAVFVILAGIGITLMTRKVRLSQDDVSLKSARIQIWKRSLFLLGLGMLLLLCGWRADILHYYAFYLVVGSFFIEKSSRVLVWTLCAILGISQILLLVLDYTWGWDASFQNFEAFWTATGFISNLLFNGYHPIFPWVCFLLLGMWLGRVDLKDTLIRKKLAIGALIGFVLVEFCSALLIYFSSPVIGLEIAQYLFQTKPMPPNLFYMLSSSCTAILTILGCIYLSERSTFQNWLSPWVYTGQLALTHYVGHFLLLTILYLVGYSDVTLWIAVLISFLFFLGAMLFSSIWRRFYKRGPIEFMMRKMSSVIDKEQ
ncbi:DUF418 domain-containing protein [Hazenella sp. IB182357]|uniref:DUF418 domain-containing protein n=1 Tax=Polycladospora coralii TaxID=2771432 RepID=A0A926NDM4_9BACL|nr:DUF418 domain-containing protein [Polycladospora coralii]MBD1371523.1 DUF418 domain-containing protein [Polycladospora coralii]